MASDSSFDIVSQVNMQEVDNAVNQTLKEISQRYDFKGAHTEVTIEGDSLKILAADDYKLKSVIEILKVKLVTRKVPIKNLEYGKVEDASSGAKRQMIKIRQGVETEIAKKIVKEIKNLALKVQAQIMNDQVRVTGKNKDDLQQVIQHLKGQDFGLELQFVNYR